MPEPHHAESVEAVERPASISHLVHTIRAYMPAILLSWIAVGLGYLIFALIVFLLAPSQRVTSQHFRISFDGIAQGRYPNGTKFSTAEIVSAPVLLKVYQQNHLERFTGSNEFSRALFILEANAEYEQLATEYQARLTDLRLSPMDRERIQKEWESRATAIAKNDYSINYLRTSDTAAIPESVVRKTLVDVLNEWSSHAIREQHVLKYPMSMLSPDFLKTSSIADDDYIVRLQILRSKIFRIMNNIGPLEKVPGAPLVRTADGLSLQEIHLRLEELVRFRLEPLNGTVRASGMIRNPATTLRFLESQLAYDQRDLKSAQEQSDSVREALAVYAMNERVLSPESSNSSPAGGQSTRPKGAGGTGETAMQFTESFIDRLVSLTHQAGDTEYRQRLVDDYRRLTANVIPVQATVAYDQEILNLVKGAPSGGSGGVTADEVKRQIAGMDDEMRHMVARVNEIFDTVSRNLNPGTEMFALTSPPTTRTEYGKSLRTLGLYGVLTLLASLPVIVVLCLLHARVREEEESEGYAAPAGTTSA
jgi:hypothetical protein